MSNDPAICKKLNRAISAAKKSLTNNGTKEDRVIIIRDPDCPFHIEYIRRKEIRKIRITLGVISPSDEKLCRQFTLPGTLFTKEIWCRHHAVHGFDKREIY